jgi:tRNA G18 (ribose-2'-O)-methylase SpoU
MPRIEINSLADPRLEPYRQLKDTNQTRWAGRFVAEGEKLARRLLESSFGVHSLLVDGRHADAFLALTPPDVPLLVVPDGLIEHIVGFNFHRGVLACGVRKPGPTVEELVGSQHALPTSRRHSPFASDPARLRTLVICPDVQDPENLGAMLRIGAAFGVDALVLGKACADPFSRRVLRVSMGASLRVPIVQSPDLPHDLTRLRDAGIELIASVLDPQAEPLSRVKRPTSMALLLGNEGHGLGPQWLSLCDRLVTIPMHSGIDSLNVSVAAGILLYHFVGLRDTGT